MSLDKVNFGRLTKDVKKFVLVLRVRALERATDRNIEHLINHFRILGVLLWKTKCRHVSQLVDFVKS